MSGFGADGCERAGEVEMAVVADEKHEKFAAGQTRPQDDAFKIGVVVKTLPEQFLCHRRRWIVCKSGVFAGVDRVREIDQKNPTAKLDAR